MSFECIFAIILPISTIFQKPHIQSLATVAAVVFVGIGITLNLLIKSVNAEFVVAVQGGPQTPVVLEAVPSDASLIATEAPRLLAESEGYALSGLLSLEDASLESEGRPFSSLLPDTDGFSSVYKVKKGDTLSGIAQKFGVSLNTLLIANPNVKASKIALGAEIKVPPLSGATHKVQPGETILSIATLYQVDTNKILEANKLVTRGLQNGDVIMIPGVETVKLAVATKETLPNFPGYFGLPASGLNQGELHSNNGIDIANRCGTPIYAAAEGLVTKVGESKEYNQGYGGMVVIEHPNGTESLYGHNEKNLVEIGDYVKKGAKIAEMGDTGKATGCHLHFETHGAKNPFAK